MASEPNAPTEPGYYWALWCPEIKTDNVSGEWEVVHVWENFLGEPCEADRDEKFRVDIPGVSGAKWASEFKWGSRVVGQRLAESLQRRIASMERAILRHGLEEFFADEQPVR